MPIGPFSRKAPVRVQPFFGFRSSGRLFLNARALRSREPVFKKRSFFSDFATMLGQYASREVADLPVTLEYSRADGSFVSQQVTSGPEGFVRFDVALDPDCPVPQRTHWEKATLRWERPDGTAAQAAAYILAPGAEAQHGIISDIDDTILETGITGSVRAIARNWKRVMAQMPSDRVVVPGASAFYAAIGGNPSGSREPIEAIDALRPTAQVRPVFYVSSSPWNLFSYLVTFKRERGLPLGPVMLRDWGFNRRTLGKKGHGSHKQDAIARILATFPDLRFALIGDDTQKDMVAFGNIAAAHPGRIAAVFIRSASGEPLSAEELQAQQAIQQAGVPFWNGNDYHEAESFLESAGLHFEGGVEQLVRTVSDGASEV